MLATAVAWAVIVAVFGLTTSDQYGADLLGDARSYALMAMNYASPNSILQPLPAIYASRLLPPLVVGWFVGSTPTPELLPAAIPAVVAGFRWLNFVASGATVAMTFLTLRRLAFSPLICGMVSVSFLSLFLGFRLYLLWPEMTDPLGFSLLAGMVYCIIGERWWTCIAVGCLAALTRENALFVLPCVWIGTRHSPPGTRLLIGLGSLAPILLLILVRRFPYFPSEVLAPNSAMGLEVADSYVPPALSWTRDYADLVVFTVLRFASARAMITTCLLVPCVFGVHAVIVTLGWREMRGRKWLTTFWPFAVATIAVGSTVDRYLFYLFPLVLIATATVLDASFPNRLALMRFVFVAGLGQVVLYDHLLPVHTGQYFGDHPFADAHQVEFMTMEELNRFAVKFTIVSAVLWVAWRRWAKSPIPNGAL